MKILIVRFSSIGDIVLTTPVITALKEADPKHVIHYLTKKSFSSILENNRDIDRLFLMEKDLNEIVGQLKEEEYDLIIDLHNNLRTKSLKAKLRRPSRSFRKLNVAKWILVNFKIDKLPRVHIVDRYLDTVRDLIKDQPNRASFFISETNKLDTTALLGVDPESYISVSVGAKFATKQIPTGKLKEILDNIGLPIVLLGGPDDFKKGEEISEAVKGEVKNMCGRLNLQQSASAVAQSKVLLTSDTGLMHIASCFDVPIVSVWGNTVPELGMYPYRPDAENTYTIHEVKELNCRPCSKIGSSSCPKKHFDCMMQQDVAAIRKDLTRN